MRAAVSAGHRVSVVAGPSAAIAALVVSGMPTGVSCSKGSCPERDRDAPAGSPRSPRAAHDRAVRSSASRPPRRSATSPPRSATSVASCSVRELTKLHEEVWRGSLGDGRAHVSDVKPRGEYVLVVVGAPEPEAATADDVEAALRAHLAAGSDRKSAVADVARESRRREARRLRRVASPHPMTRSSSTWAHTASLALLAAPESNGGCGSYSMPSWITWATSSAGDARREGERHVDARRHARRGDDLALLDHACAGRRRAELASVSSDAQWVVASMPSSKPAAASSIEPVHTDVVHVRRRVRPRGSIRGRLVVLERRGCRSRPARRARPGAAPRRAWRRRRGARSSLSVRTSPACRATK